jgi:hypothetical protein
LAALPPKKGRHRVTKRQLRAGLKHIKNLDALLATGPGAAIRSPHARIADSAPVSAGGWTGSATAEIPVHDDQTGTDITVHVDATRDDGTNAKATETHSELVADCPDSKGNVSGSAKRSYRLVITASAKDGDELRISTGYQATFTIEGHTSTTGELHDWQQTMSFLAHVQVAVLHKGKVVQTNAPWVMTMHATRDEKPGDTALDYENVTELTSPGQTIKLFGNQLYSSTVDRDAALGFTKLAAFTFDEVAGAVQGALEKAKHDHWDSGDCVKVALSTPNSQLQPGESADVTEQLSSPKGNGVAPATLTAAADGGGVVTPPSTTADAAPLHFTAIAPSPFDQGSSFTVTVNAVSHQGHGSGSITFTRQPSGYTLHFTYTQSGDPSYHYDNSTTYFTDFGDFSEHRDLAISATLPLTANPDGTYSGSGAVAWDRFAWTSDDNNTSSNNGGTTCTIDYATTHSQQAPGALAVAGLTLGAQPTAKFTLSGLGDHIHTDETPAQGSPCPGFPQDDDQTELLNSFYNQHASTTGSPQYVTDGNGNVTAVKITLNSGWGASDGTVQSWTTSGAMYGDGPHDPPDAIHYTETYTITAG